jgi:hypothetical protein
MEQIPFTNLSQMSKGTADKEEIALFGRWKLCFENGIRHY